MDINIYLDIDGVLLTSGLSPANYVREFIKYILENYHSTTYWLTTHCQGDASYAIRHLEDIFEPEIIELLTKVKPTTWLNSSAKTDAIDFSKPFLWFDDNLFIKERDALIKHGVLDNWIGIDLRKDPDQLGKFIQSFPIPIDVITGNLNEGIH